MNNIIGSSGSPDAFWNFINPFISMCLNIVSVPVFGIPLYLYLLNFLVVFTVIGFVMKGSVGAGIAVKLLSSDETKKHDSSKRRKGDN